MNLVEELERLSLTLNSLNEDQAKSIIGYVNKMIDDQLNPHIIDILRKQEEEAMQGINRVVSLVRKPGMCLDRSNRGRVGTYFIPPEVSESTRGLGLWAWVYNTAEPVWLENIKSLPGLVKSKDYRVVGDAKPDPPIKNIATGEEIDHKYFSAFHETDSIMVVPLLSRKVMYGIYSIELPYSRRFTAQTLDLLKQLSTPLARIIYKAEVADLSREHTTRAIDLFKESAQASAPLNEFRSAFIARPFEPEMEKLEDYIANCLLDEGVKAEPYESIGGEPQIIEGIVNSIRSSHFVIADLTGNNPNVLFELGVAIDSEKEVLIFKRKDDQEDPPFDLGTYPCYRYEIGPKGRISVSKPQGGSTPCKEVVRKMVRKLETDNRVFSAAKRWRPTKDVSPANREDTQASKRPQAKRKKRR